MSEVDLTERIRRLEASVRQLSEAVASHQQPIEQLQRVAAAHGEGLGSHARWLADMERWVTSCVKTLASLGSQPLGGGAQEPRGSLDIVGALRAQLEVWAVMDWIAHAGSVPEDLLVSVVVATRNRPALLRRAVSSIVGQSYGHLEVIVVDDSDEGASTDATRSVMGEFDDRRVRTIQTGPAHGSARAFNAGLDAADGDVIAALDDDNVMHPDWLRSVVWAFTTHPEVDALYGARTIEDKGARDGVASGSLPLLEFQAYDRRRHERANYIDRNVIAYRKALKNFRYDEGLPAAIDWDQSLRMFRSSAPLAVPALACYYRTTIPGRVTDEPGARDGVRIVRKRAFLDRPLRVLVHTAMFPVVSESYIGEDIAALESAGAEVVVSAVQEAASRLPGAREPRFDVENVISEFQPDVVLLHWSTHARSELPFLERLDQPFACRVHSFENDREGVQLLLDHPLCVAVFAHETEVPSLPSGVHGLIPTVGPATAVPPGRERRTGVVSVSAGLPKKDFPLLVEALSQLPGTERTIVTARTNGHESLPEEVAALAATADRGISVRVNMARPDVLDLVARSSALIYTLDPASAMGLPMSIVEAMLCGTLVIAPDRPEAHHLVGPDLMTYRDAGDIARHVRRVMAGGPQIEAGRARLRSRGARHRDPAEIGRIHTVLRAALADRLDQFV